MDRIKCITFDPEAQAALPAHIKEKMRQQHAIARNKCPECGAELIHESGCAHCPECGWAACNN